MTTEPTSAGSPTSGMADLEEVGGKNASLGEMVANLADLGVRVPDGFATTADAFRLHRRHRPGRADRRPARRLDTEDVRRLAEAGTRDPRLGHRAGVPRRTWRPTSARPTTSCRGDRGASRRSPSAPRPPPRTCPTRRSPASRRPSSTSAGIDAVLHGISEVFASLYNDRAIAYRVHHGFEHDEVALSAGVQRMVRSDVGASGVMFTMDTESGFHDAVFITSAYGLGEGVVQGAVNPDEFYVYKPALRDGRPAILKRGLGGKAPRWSTPTTRRSAGPPSSSTSTPADGALLSLTDDEVEELARHALVIEEHYGRPMDIEWGKDGVDGQLYILQARPETVKSRGDRGARAVPDRPEQSTNGAEVLVEGRAIGQKIGAGAVRVLTSLDQMHEFSRRRARRRHDRPRLGADHEARRRHRHQPRRPHLPRRDHRPRAGHPGGRRHRQRDQGPRDGREVTVSCAEGDTGLIYDGLLDFERRAHRARHDADIPVKIMMNVGNPERAFAFAQLPHRGVGLARLEFIINRQIGIHPKALLEFDRTRTRCPTDLRAEIEEKIAAYAGPRDFFVDRLAEGIATIAGRVRAAPGDRADVRLQVQRVRQPHRRLALRAARGEPDDRLPRRLALPLRGFADCFALECEALRNVRDEMGLTNVWVMIPFVRTLAEAQGRHRPARRARPGARRERPQGHHDVRGAVQRVLADEFLEHFDGFSIGSNDLTQLTLGLDRDSALVADLFDERDPAVKNMLELAIKACKAQGKYVGICGQGPCDHPDLAEWLIEQGIESVSLNPDTVVDTWLRWRRSPTCP